MDVEVMFAFNTKYIGARGLRTNVRISLLVPKVKAVPAKARVASKRVRDHRRDATPATLAFTRGSTAAVLASNV